MTAERQNGAHSYTNFLCSSGLAEQSRDEVDIQHVKAAELVAARLFIWRELFRKRMRADGIQTAAEFESQLIGTTQPLTRRISETWRQREALSLLPEKQIRQRCLSDCSTLFFCIKTW